MKRIFVLALVLTLCFTLLSGCGDSSTPSVTDTKTTASQESTTAAGSAKAEPVTLTFMWGGTKDTGKEDFVLETLPKLVKEKFSNITIEATKLPHDQYVTTVQTKMAASEGPDIFMGWPKMGTISAIDFGKIGYAKDISDMNFVGNFAKGALDDFSYNGKLYGVPNGMAILGVYYNKALFQQAGIMEIPKDWPSFLDACSKLKAKEITPLLIPGKDSYYAQFGLYQITPSVVYADDMDFDLKLQAGQESFTNPKWIKSLTMYKDLYDKGYVINNSLGMGGTQVAQLFIDGKGAMTIDGSWNYDALMAKGSADFERGFFPLPGNDAGKQTLLSAATSDGYMVNAGTGNYDSVKQVMEYWFDGQSPLFTAWAQDNSALPVYKGLTLKNEIFNDYYTQYQNGISIYFNNQMWPSGVSDELCNKFQEIIGGRNTTPEDIARAMDAKFKENWKGQ